MEKKIKIWLKDYKWNSICAWDKLLDIESTNKDIFTVVYDNTKARFWLKKDWNRVFWFCEVWCKDLVVID